MLSLMCELFFAGKTQCTAFVVAIGERDGLSGFVFEYNRRDPVQCCLRADVADDTFLFFAHQALDLGVKFFGKPAKGDGRIVAFEFLHEAISIAQNKGFCEKRRRVSIF